ncbi:hypothetical protein HDV00_005976 [Rhizophlyctis rosea]|nr:hypothetical protein HDV00_005976 [Rhizophlyctis rosea]
MKLVKRKTLDFLFELSPSPTLDYVSAVRSGISSPRPRNPPPTRPSPTNRKPSVGRERPAKTPERSSGGWQQTQLRWSTINPTRHSAPNNPSPPRHINHISTPAAPPHKQSILTDPEAWTPRPPISTYTPLPPQLAMENITSYNVEMFRRLNMVLFPVRYNDRFYRDVCETHARELSNLARWENEVIGAISCRKEPASSAIPTPYRVYIMTLGVLAPYRRLKIGMFQPVIISHIPSAAHPTTYQLSPNLQPPGSYLLNRIETYCRTDPSVHYLCLHVQITNVEAIGFYTRNGFRIQERINGYYNQNKGVDPPDAFFLRKDLKDLPWAV